MKRATECKVEGCENPVHSTGYCCKHYSQIRRKGRIYDAEIDATSKKTVAWRRNETDRIRGLERELRRAEAMYNNVVGMEGKLKWRRELTAIKQEMTRLGMPVPPAGTEKRTPGSVFVAFEV